MKVPQPVYGTRSNGLLRSLNGVIRDGASPTVHIPTEEYGKKEGGSPRTVLVQSSTDSPTHLNNTTNNKPIQPHATIINNSVVNATTSNLTETSSTSSSVQNNPSINTAAAQGTIILDNRSNLIIKKIPSSDDNNKNNSASDDNCSESEPQTTSTTTIITTAPPSSASQAIVSSSSLSANSVHDSTAGYRGSNNTVIISNRLNPQHQHHLNSLQSQYLISEPSPSQLHIPHSSMPPYSWPFDLSTKTDISEKGEILPGMVVGGGTPTLFETMRNNNIALYSVGEATLLNHAPANVNEIIDDTLKEYNQEEQHGQNEEANYLTLNSANGEAESRSPMHHEDISFVQLQNVTQMNQIMEADYEHENG